MPKTIDDIIPPSRRRQMTAETTPPITPNASPVLETPMPPEPPQRVRIKTGRSFPYGTALIALIVIVVCAGVLYAFSNAQVTITPATQKVSVNGDFTATANNGDLPFTVVTVSKVASKNVPAESTQTANDSSQGQVVISNAQPKAQALITNTRFQTPSGLIYRIHNAITVPAANNGTPGTLTVTVYADQPGQNYNIGPTTFTLPGLQGSATYTLVTAKSGGSMTGGFTGTRAAVSQATDDSNHTTLQSALATSLQTELMQKVPQDDVLIPGATFTNYTATPDTATTTASVQINEQGSITALAFPKDALAKAIAYKDVGTYSGEPVTLSDASRLILAPSASVSSSTDYSSLQSLDFTLSGSTQIVWKVDTAKIAGAVAGKTRDSAQSILSGFSEVDKAVLILRPFWASTFPQDPSHIKVSITQPQGN